MALTLLDESTTLNTLPKDPSPIISTSIICNEEDFSNFKEKKFF